MSAPAQPTQEQAYTTPGNPAETEPAEKATAAATSQSNANAGATEQRVPQKQTRSSDEATPTSLGRGIHGAPAGEERKGLSNEDVGQHKELDGEQMRAPGEGEVRDAVKGEQPSGGEGDMASGMEAKKKEQAPLRKEKEEKRAQDVDVQGVLGQRAAPADPTE